MLIVGSVDRYLSYYVSLLKIDRFGLFVNCGISGMADLRVIPSIPLLLKLVLKSLLALAP